jgi:tyrosyl-tRNA synthetase
MQAFKSEMMQVLSERGFMHQCSDVSGLDTLASNEPITAYVGFDCTAPSLHVGNLMQIMLLNWLQKTGHKPIALMGGGTTKVGDPSGRDETRQLLTGEQIDENMASIKKSFANYLSFGSGKTDAVMANNADWLDTLLYIPLLRDVGRHFSVNRMLTMDSVKLRLERDQPLTFLEFNYMILQSYDFVELFKRHNCILQMGGSDQWGNIVMGADLGRRMAGAELFALTSPLLATSSGAKMGKTAAGAVWLNPERLSPYEFWQYWRNAEDADVGRFLRLFTDLPLTEIARLEALGGAEINEAKKLLATEATRLAHGADAAAEAAETARRAFEEGEAVDTLPGVDVPRVDLEAGIPAFRLFAIAGLAGSNGEARRLIRGGGARINDIPIKDEGHTVTVADLHDNAIKLSAGRKHHRLVRAA